MNQPLRELWDRIDAGPPPLGEISASAGPARRRRRGAVLAAAAVVLAVVGSGVAVQRTMLDDDRATDLPSGMPAPPDGTRWVGLGRVVVAVPDWWTTGETQCLAPVETTVYFDSGATADCADPADPATIREVSALAVLDATGGYGEYQTRSMQPVAEVDGEAVLEADACEEWFEGVCRRMFAVPSEGVVFAVTIADEGDGSYEDIRDSIRILPDGLTTVPLAISSGWTPAWGADPRAADELVKVFDEAGLRVETEVAERSERDDVSSMSASFPAGTLLDVSPSLGSVIEEGGTVTITVAGKPERR